MGAPPKSGCGEGARGTKSGDAEGAPLPKRDVTGAGPTPEDAPEEGEADGEVDVGGKVEDSEDKEGGDVRPVALDAGEPDETDEPDEEGGEIGKRACDADEDDVEGAEAGEGDAGVASMGFGRVDGRRRDAGADRATDPDRMAVPDTIVGPDARSPDGPAGPAVDGRVALEAAGAAPPMTLVFIDVSFFRGTGADVRAVSREAWEARCSVVCAESSRVS
ncbi:hypothetical protein [Pendulispora albinea]|uniref:Uncharacterized protein n=1 Tax=Pendulispora albinea TaxID=2741071 RepID=A0ABZ2LSC6_9BACT